MGIFSFIAEKKKELRFKRQVMAERRAQNLEKQAQYETILGDKIRRQEVAKEQIRQAKREQHPLLYKIGDSVKNKLAEAKKNKSSVKIRSTNNNIFTQTGDQTPYWLKSSKKNDKPYWLK